MKALSIIRCLVALTCAALTVDSLAATALKGKTVNLSIRLTAGSTPLKYHWYRNGRHIAGTQVPKLTLYNVRLDDSGTYTVRVINAYGETVSNAQVLVVRAR